MTEQLIVQNTRPIPVDASPTEEKRISITRSSHPGVALLSYSAHPESLEVGEGVGTLKRGQSVVISNRHWFQAATASDDFALLIEDA